MDPMHAGGTVSLPNTNFGVTVPRVESTQVLFQLLGNVDTYLLLLSNNSEKIFNTGIKIYGRKDPGGPFTFLQSLPFDTNAFNNFAQARVITSSMTAVASTISTTNATLGGTIMASILPNLPATNALTMAELKDDSIQGNCTEMLPLSEGVRTVAIPNPQVPKFAILTNGSSSPLYGGDTSWSNVLSFTYATNLSTIVQNNNSMFVATPGVGGAFITVVPSNFLPNFLHGDMLIRVVASSVAVAAGVPFGLVLSVVTTSSTSVTDPTPVNQTNQFTFYFSAASAASLTASGYVEFRINTGDVIVTSISLSNQVGVTQNIANSEARLSLIIEMRDMIPAEINNLQAILVAPGGENKGLTINSTVITEVVLNTATFKLVRPDVMAITSSKYYAAVSEYLTGHPSYSFVGSLFRYHSLSSSGEYYRPANNMLIGAHTSFFSDAYVAAKRLAMDAGSAIYDNRRAIGAGMMATPNPYLRTAGAILQYTSDKDRKKIKRTGITAHHSSGDTGEYPDDVNPDAINLDDDPSESETVIIPIKMKREEEEEENEGITSIPVAIVINQAVLGSGGPYAAHFAQRVFKGKRLPEIWPSHDDQQNSGRDTSDHPITVRGELRRTDTISTPLTKIGTNLTNGAKYARAVLAHNKVQIEYIPPYVVNAFPVVLKRDDKESCAFGCAIAFNKADRPNILMIRTAIDGNPEVGVIPYDEGDFINVGTDESPLFINKNCGSDNLEKFGQVFLTSKFNQQLDSVVVLSVDVEDGYSEMSVDGRFPFMEPLKTQLRISDTSVGASDQAAVFTSLCGVMANGPITGTLVRATDQRDVYFGMVGDLMPKFKGVTSADLILVAPYQSFKTGKKVVNAPSELFGADAIMVKVQGAKDPGDVLLYSILGLIDQGSSLVSVKETVEGKGTISQSALKKLAEEKASVSLERSGLSSSDPRFPATEEAINWVVKHFDVKKYRNPPLSKNPDGKLAAPKTGALTITMFGKSGEDYTKADIAWRDRTAGGGEGNDVNLGVAIARHLINAIGGSLESSYTQKDGMMIPFSKFPESVRRKVIDKVALTQPIENKSKKKKKAGASGGNQQLLARILASGPRVARRYEEEDYEPEIDDGVDELD